MDKWKRSLFGHSRWYCKDKQIHLLTPYETGRAGVMLYRDGELEVVADWEGTLDGVRIWRNGIAQVSPQAGALDDLTLLRVLNDVQQAFHPRMKLHVLEARGKTKVWSSDDWIRSKP